MKKLTNEEFIEKANLKHNNKYSYDKTKYTTTKNFVIVTCLIHGDFKQKANSHLNGNGCKQCYLENRAKIRTKSITTFITQANNVHNYKYSYLKYIKDNIKIPIICPEHGEFMQTPNSHLSGIGCPICGNIATGISKRMSNKDFLEKSKLIHNDFYTYNKTLLITTNKQITITCPIHGDFKQTPNSHLAGKGCKKCASILTGSKLTHNYEDVITKCAETHNSKYSYTPTSNYVNTTSKLTIICNTHGKFKQKAADHLAGRGCPKCANIRRNKSFIDEPTVLYYVYFPNIKLYKIGITLVSNGITKRFKGEKEPYEIIHSETFLNGYDAYRLEQQILLKYHKQRVKKKIPQLTQGGYTECFNSDILNLHNSTIKEFIWT